MIVAIALLAGGVTSAGAQGPAAKRPEAGRAKRPPVAGRAGAPPAPRIRLAEAEDYAAGDGRRYVIYRLAVVNLSEYPGELFGETHGLPPDPCRGEDPVRMLWAVYTKDGEKLSCGKIKARSADFRAVFRERRGEAGRDVYVVLTDAKKGTNYRSKVISVGAP